MKKTLLLLVLCALTAPGGALAQATADDLFHWFPQGSYLTLAHRNYEALQRASIYELFQRIYAPQEEGEKSAAKGKGAQGLSAAFGASEELKVGRELEREKLELPPTLREGVYWATTGTVLELADLPNDEEDEPLRLLEVSEERTVVSLNREASGDKTLAVYRTDDPTAVERALKAGELKDTGKKFLGRTLYSFSLAGGGEREEELLLWIATDGDILVARDRKLLARMIFTGRGRIGGILGDPLYADLQGVVLELGQIWRIEYSQLLARALAKAVDEGTVEDENAGSLVIGNGPLYHVWSLNVDDVVVSTEIAVYESSEQAEAAYENSENDTEAGVASLVMESGGSAIDSRKKRELRHNLIISRVAIDVARLAKE